MKIVIVEDEQLAAEKLERYLLKYSSEVTVVSKLSSIAMAVEWFQTHERYKTM